MENQRNINSIVSSWADEKFKNMNDAQVFNAMKSFSEMDFVFCICHFYDFFGDNYYRDYFIAIHENAERIIRENYDEIGVRK